MQIKVLKQNIKITFFSVLLWWWEKNKKGNPQEMHFSFAIIMIDECWHYLILKYMLVFTLKSKTKHSKKFWRRKN